MMKDLWQSKTFWFNTLALIVGMGELTPVLDLMSDSQLKYFMAVVAITNLILRIWFTDSGIRQARK